MEPSERGCIKCGYNLTGLPAAGTVVTCPECGHATDLAVPTLRRISLWTSIGYGMVPASAGIIIAGFVLMTYRTVRFGEALCVWLMGIAIVVGLCLGAAIAGFRAFNVLTYRPAMGLQPRPLWTRVILAAVAAGVIVVLDVTILRWLFNRYFVT